MTVKHPEKVLFPDSGITRGEVAAYYARIAPVLLPHYRDRALTVTRWPHGVTGPMFYQRHPQGRADAPIAVDRAADIVRWVGLGVIEWHVPLGRMDRPSWHDWAVMDMDPHPPAGWPEVQKASRLFCRLLHQLDLPFRLKTSGRRGVHFYIPITAAPAPDVVGAMARLADIMVWSYPDGVTVAPLKKDRGPRVYLDFRQNSGTRTMAGVYTLRAGSGAEVSAPIRESELGEDPRDFTMGAVLARIRQYGDLFAYAGDRVDLARHLKERGIVDDKKGE